MEWLWDNLVHIHSIHDQCQVRAEFDSRSLAFGDGGHRITRLICYSLVFTLDNCGSGVGCDDGGGDGQGYGEWGMGYIPAD